MSLWTNIIKYVKIFLVHPATEIIINIIYLMSFLVILFITYNGNKYYNDLDILDMTESYLNYNNFINIKTPSQLDSYIITILDKLFTIDPANNEIPLFIPLNPIRVIPFNNENSCSEINYNINCRNEVNKFKCVIDNLSKSFQNKCGEAYSDSYNFFQNKLIGHYSTYHIGKMDNYIDMTRESFYSTHKDKIDTIIKDKRLKALLLQINLINPSNRNYIDAVLGIEMTTYFSDVKTIFSAYVMNDKRPSTNLLIFIYIILFCISKIVSILKFIFEINVKCVWSIHVVSFLIEAFDATFTVLLIMLLVEDKNLKFEINMNKFESHLRYINIIWFMKMFIAVSVIFFPFRFLSLISWWKSLIDPFILLINAIFRMFQGIFITLIIFFLLIIMSFFTNYYIFNDIFEYYETMFVSFITAFDLNIVESVYDRKFPSKIFGNLFTSKFTAFFVFFEVVMFYFIFAIIIATMVYLFKKAVISLEPPEKNIYIKKLEEIQEKLKENKNTEIENENLINKQILWINLDNKNSNTNMIAKYQPLIFKNSIEILSYLKYIFAIKPEIQFKKLIHKINIIIEINQKNNLDKEIKQIYTLAEWLIFVGSRIPIIIYGKINFDRSIKMKLYNIYKLIYIINDDNSLENIIKNEGQKILSISKNDGLQFKSSQKE